MNQRGTERVSLSVRAAVISALLPVAASVQVPARAAGPLELPDEYTFATVANTGEVIPGGSGKYFNSFNPPSVNTAGVVVLRGRSKGPQPVHGIYARRMGARPGPLIKVFDNGTAVPPPNNTDYNGSPANLTEFPAFPRIGADSDTIATRGQSQPVWSYLLSDGSETRVGTSGIYAMRLGRSVSAMTQLGAVPVEAQHDFSRYSVPGAPAATRFDQFPGAPAVSGTNTVVFKGNYTDGGRKTGVFFRTFSVGMPNAPTQVIANSHTAIPGTAVAFGSTAPPSASDTDVVFLGLDNEEWPSLGGIYRAALSPSPPLTTLVNIGGQVPGEPSGTTFSRLGEALSYDGRFVAFWGAWRAETRWLTLICPQDGQAARIQNCLERYPNGYIVAVPVHQGVFVHDAQSRRTYPAAKTGAVYQDFLYWTFSGRVPGMEHSDSEEAEDFEEARWRSAAFVATWSQGSRAQAAFKARRVDGAVDGIYVTVAPSSQQAIHTVVETGWPGQTVDPAAAGLPIVALGLERDGLRNGWLAITASMSSGESAEAGVYVTRTLK